MDEYAIDIFGKFNNVDIISIVEPDGSFWFSQEIIAQALDVDRTALTHIRQNHPGEFTEHEDYKSIVFQGKRRVVYSEEGFLTICDMSSSEAAFRLRKWMRQQFRVKHSGSDLVVQSKAKGLPREDLSGLGKDLVILQHMLDSLAEDRRRIMTLEVETKAIEEEQGELKERVGATEEQLALWVHGAKIKPGEMTAIELARHCGWVSRSGAPHNLAVILAAANAGFVRRKLMQPRQEQGPNGLKVEVWVFTQPGVHEFLQTIDPTFGNGQKFDLLPNDIASEDCPQIKNRRSVLKH